MNQERLALLALHFVPGIGDFLVKQLVSYCGSASAAFKMPKGKLMKIPGIGESSATSLKNHQPFQKAEEELKKAEKENVKILFYLDQEFPLRLKQFDDCPSILYLKGNVDINTKKTVAIVGTRQATAYGKEVVQTLVDGLVPYQPLIISGLAYGIDIHAHKQALKNNLPTLGVMGSGIDIIYPAAHRETACKMLTNGGLVTENPIGTKPDAHNFPARNRIIAALADALVVVEAAERGGALITAEIANNYNKDVFAVPGAIGQLYSEGCNKLIKINKAHLITGVKDIAYIMNWNVETSTTQIIGDQLDLALYDADEQIVMTLLKEKKGAMAIDELSRKSSLSPSTLASLLLNLEFKNAVRSMPGKLYTLSKGHR